MTAYVQFDLDLWSFCNYLKVEAVIKTATLFHRDTAPPAPHKSIITETALSTGPVTAGINAAGTGVPTLCATQVVVAIFWTLHFC